MNIKDIQEDIAAFADNEESVFFAPGGKILFERNRQLVECQLLEASPGEVEVEHNGVRMQYLSFLGEELGRLSILAHAVQQKRPAPTPYIDTHSIFTDSIGNVQADRASATETLRKACSDRVPGETRLIFLTADAGEGKTAVLRKLANSVANNYMQNKCKWLLLHIDTQGRSFVRLEEAVAGELGKLRIAGLFYPGVIRLIKNGLLAIAIDGFDELLAEIGSGEAYSGLGGFLRQLNGAGVVIAAARSAYFEAENYSAQSQLLSSLPDAQVTVEQLRLETWQKPQTLLFYKKYRSSDGAQIQDPEGTYDEIEKIVGTEHVVLHRPFLVHQMAKMLASPDSSAQNILATVGTGLEVVPRVIEAYLKREVEEKWRDSTGHPYLSLNQHEHLLAAIADEMWIQSSNSLSVEIVQLVAETILDEFDTPHSQRVAIFERVKAHAFLPISAATRVGYRSFDHDEFFSYFLSIRLVELLRNGNKSNIKTFLDRGLLPAITAKWISVLKPWASQTSGQLLALLSNMCASELRATYFKYNAALIASCLTPLANAPTVLESMYFEGDQWSSTKIKEVEFKRCEFNNVVLAECNWSKCLFKECRINGLTLRNTRIDGAVFDASCQVLGVLHSTERPEEYRTYIPEICKEILAQCGATFERTDPIPQIPLRQVSPERRTTLNSFLRIFNRNSGAADRVIQLKLGARVHLFEKEILPNLIDNKVVRKAEYRGKGHQHRYELNYPVDLILRAEDPQSVAPENLIAFWNRLCN